jgi:sRNA-binding carbon storage regulator CsrA
MLILSRRVRERIVVPQIELTVTLVAIKGNTVVLAPPLIRPTGGH